jgi:hypothetical protein
VLSTSAQHVTRAVLCLLLCVLLILLCIRTRHSHMRIASKLPCCCCHLANGPRTRCADIAWLPGVRTFFGALCCQTHSFHAAIGRSISNLNRS